MSAGRLSLIPARLLELPATGWELAALGRARRLTGVVMVVDVCGFTALSEAAGREGPEGTERLSHAINAVFSPIVSLVHEHGGEVALFVGDAVVAVLPGAAAARACAAAIHAGAGSYELSVGLAAGDLTSTVVGDPVGRLEHVLIGRVLARAAAAERRAGPGRTVEDGALVDGSVAGSPRNAPDLVAPFLHPSVAARLDAGRDRLLAEHRRVTALFCRFEDLREDDPEAPARLQSLVAAALETLARYGGALLQVEMVDKGSTLKAAFGAPLAHEDDERRATACARALLARPELTGAAIGISTGTVYCGLIGSAARREYTVLGDTVNVAARLMLAARPGQILATEATRVRAGEWAWRPAGPLAVRGRTERVMAFEPTREEAPAKRSRAGPFVGREREREAAVRLLGSGAVLTVTGEAGIGKSRLIDALVDVAHERGIGVLRGTGRPQGRDVAYGAFRDAARELFPAAEPIIAPLRGLPPPESELSPELRAEALRDRVVERLRARQPLLVAIEDAQWLDEPSRDLLERLARELPELRVLVVLTVRSGEARGPGRLPAGATLALAPLADSAIAQLVAGPPELVASAVERSGGNPLFAEEFVKLRQDHAGAAVPDSLRAVVTARLDMLPERERAALRIASVIGQRFAPEWLWGADPRLEAAEVGRSLATLVRLDLVRRDGSEHAFNHGVTREVAYDTLAVAAREHLHHAVARHIERTHDLEVPDVVEMLAHHYASTTDTGKQRIYLRSAGDAARAAFANDAAIRHYRRLRPLLTGEPALDTTLDLGAMLQLTGEWAEAEALFREALASTGSARAGAALGALLALTGAYPDAIARLEDARAHFVEHGNSRELAAVLERLAHTYFQQGDDERATARAREHAALARGLGDRAGESAAINTLGLVLWHRGELGPARAQLEIALELANRVGEVHVLNDLAGLLVALGRPQDAVARLAQAYARAREIGYRRFQGLVVGNAAELFQLAGDDDAALACAAVSLEIGAALGDPLQIVHNATVIAAVQRRRGEAQGALALLERVVDVARASDNRRYLAEALVHRARALLDLMRPDEASAAAVEALTIARAVGQAALAADAEAVLAGTPPAPADVGPRLDATPFLDDEAAVGDPGVLARRAELALTRAFDVFGVPQRT